jgi:hypothetical protein
MRILFAFLSLTLAGCFSYDYVDQYEITRDKNKANLVKIGTGDTKAKVIEICGAPDKNEQFAKGGVNYDILFYYTDYIGYGKTWEVGHTPILIKSGVVIGIGWRALRVNGIESSDVSIETRSR